MNPANTYFSDNPFSSREFMELSTPIHGSIRFSFLASLILLIGLAFNSTAHAQFGTGYFIDPDEGDTYQTPTTVHQLPFERVTYIQTGSDKDYFRFTAPANMKIRVRASGRFWDDPSCEVLSSDGRRWLYNDDHENGGPGIRDAFIEFDAVGGRQYVVAVTNDRSGPCRLKIDSRELVLDIDNSDPKDTYSIDRYLEAPTWEQGTHFGSERTSSTIRRHAEIRHYCLDRMIIDYIGTFSDGRFGMERDFSLPVLVDRPLSMELDFSPPTAGYQEGFLLVDYRIGSKREWGETIIGGIGVRSNRASVFFGTQFNNFSSFVPGAFVSRDDAAHYHQFRAPVSGPTQYRAIVFGYPERADQFDLVGTAMTNSFNDIEMAANSYGAFTWTSEPLTRGEQIFIKAEVAPHDLSAALFPARYRLYVYFVPM